MDEEILISDLSKSFGKNVLFKNQDIRLMKHKTNLLVGKNGVGKTTIMSIISNVEKADKPFKGAPNKIIFFSEKVPYVENISGESNIEFLLYTIGLKVNTSEIDEMAAFVGLDREAIKMPVYNYSMGMSEKLKLIIFLLIDMDWLFLFDEPFSTLDIATLRKGIELVKNSGKTVLLCTHLEDIAKQVVNGYINVLEDKKIDVIKDGDFIDKI